MKEAREPAAYAHLLPVNLTGVVAEQDLSRREQGVVKDKQSWG